MCGISGFLLSQVSSSHRDLEARLWAMIAMLRHRGPDDEGVWTDRRAGLAHARLSIIDLSPAGHQPMASTDQTSWITYNGEIYNFAEIRRELEAAGYGFRSRSDTEVIVNGWQAWGEKVISRLRGMFALAIWDRRSHRLILARDRIGKKPLYYASCGDTLLFASEIKALLTWPGLPRTPDLSAIDHYLTLGYVPSPQTSFAGISKLPPAHYLAVEARPEVGSASRTRSILAIARARQRAAHRTAAELRHRLIERLRKPYGCVWCRMCRSGRFYPAGSILRPSWQ